MPIPIQLGSLTTRLRNFLRIRGRVRLMLDETVVPTVQVQDLTVGPYQAGVTPAAGTIPSPGTVGGQVLIYMNPDAAALIAPNLDEDQRFIGRSFSFSALEFFRRGTGATRYRVGMVPRAAITAATLATRKQLVSVQGGRGLQLVPVILATVAVVPFVIFPVPQEWYHREAVAATDPTNAIVPSRPETVLDRFSAIVIEETVAGAIFDTNVRGFYQEQAP